MEYETRMRLAAEQVNNFLSAFQRPTHLPEDMAIAEVRTIAEEINARISTSFDQSAFHDRIAKALRHLRSTYTQRMWPTVAHFVKAMDQTQDRSRSAASEQPTEIDALKMAAQRMNAGEKVGDSYIYGRQADELLEKGMVSAETMQGYRSGLFFAAKNAVGEPYALRLEWMLKNRTKIVDDAR